MITVDTIKSLQGKKIFPTSNENYVLTEKTEREIHKQSYKILGFIDEFEYAYANNYISKSTLDGLEISSVYIGTQINHGGFHKQLNYFYVYDYNRTLYKITDQLEIEWIKILDDYIQSIEVDANGKVYVIYKNSRTIHIILPDKRTLCSMNESDDIYSRCRLFKTYITEGRDYMYTIGTIYGRYEAPIMPTYEELYLVDGLDDMVLLDGDNTPLFVKVKKALDIIQNDYYYLLDEGFDKICDEGGNPLIVTIQTLIDAYQNTINYAETFIDKYDLNTHKRISHKILCTDTNIKADDENYYYDNLIVKDNNIYIYSNRYVQKVNKFTMNTIWKYQTGYDSQTKQFNKINHIEYDDTNYEEYLYFCEDMISSTAHSFGKLSINGDLIWKVTFDDRVDTSKFSMAIYNKEIFTANKTSLNFKQDYLLAVNNNKLLFETKDGYLISVTKDNSEEIYSSDYYRAFRLLGDRIRDGIDKYLNYTLLSESTCLLDGDNTPLLISLENPNYYNTENYEFFHMIADQIVEDLSDKTILKTLNNLTLQTKSGKILNTLNPINAPFYNEESGFYYYKKYLSCDKHIFGNILTTKRDKKVLLTKKGYAILKKKKEYFKYIYRRFADIDIIIEFFKQSGILHTLIPKYVDKLIHHTTHMIEAMQEANTPVDYDLKSQKVFEYLYDGTLYPIRISNTQIYMCKNLPFNKKRNHESIYIDSMIHLVENEEIRPFILFVDGKAIKWSNMTIIRDWYHSYIVVSNFKPSVEFEYNISSILIPCRIRYGEDNNILSGNYPKFTFDNFGSYTEEEDDISMRIEIIDPKVTEYDQSTFGKKHYIQIETKEDQLASYKNILAFENGKYFAEGINYIQAHGKNIYTYDRNISVLFKTFYFNEANTYLGHISKIPNQEILKEDIESNLNGGESYASKLSIPFDYVYHRDRTYETNVSEAVKYILNYDVSLFNDYYRKKSNVVTFSFSGKEILEKTKYGFLYMPRRRKFHLDDYVVVYRNGLLYEYFKEIIYEANMFKIPIFDYIQDDDKIEIIHYLNVNNRVYSTYITPLSKEEEMRFLDIPAVDYARVDLARLYDSSEYKHYLDNPDYVTKDIDYNGYMAKELRYDNFLIFANGNSGIYPHYTEESNVQFPVEFEYKNTFDENKKYQSTQIRVKNKYYRFKKVNITSKRTFHQMYYNVTEDTNTFELNSSFKFSQDIYKYMIFVNGKKIDFDAWTLHSPYTNPDLRTIGIVTKDTLHQGDIIEILYVPDPYDEIILNDYHINDANIIELDRDILQYPFDKELFLIYINGKKVFNDSIQNFSANKIRLLNESIDQNNRIVKITICRYIKPDNILKEVFSYHDQWSDIIDTFTNPQINELYE